MTEELQTSQQPPQPSATQTPPKQRLGPQDFRNSELVTKLMAANPPYLYSPAVGPHNFFFSEMLRSLVANKRNESLRSAEQLHHHQQQQQQQQHHQQQQQQQQQQHHHQHHQHSQQALLPSMRRPRKRSWSQHRYYPETPKDGKDPDEKSSTHVEKPLELTNKLSAFTRNIHSSKYADASADGFKLPYERKTEVAKPASEKSETNGALLADPPAASMPPSDLILPPPPPVWYPPLYPPYGIDPLHFFIDLRVSGHIYDRKKEPNSPNSDGALPVKSEHAKLIGASDRQGSAFSVPKPRTDGHLRTGSAINLSSPPDADGNGDEGSTKDGTGAGTGGAAGTGFFLGELKESKYDIIKNTNYVMQNLPRIYSDLNGIQKPGSSTDDDTNGNLSDDQQDSKSVGSTDDLDDGKYKDVDLNVISDEESIAVDEN